MFIVEIKHFALKDLFLKPFRLMSEGVYPKKIKFLLGARRIFA